MRADSPPIHGWTGLVAGVPPPMGRLDGRVAIVTGGGAGIGEAVVLKLAVAGARVVVSGLPTTRSTTSRAPPRASAPGRSPAPASSEEGTAER